MKQQFEKVKENALVEKLVKLVKSDTKIVPLRWPSPQRWSEFRRLKN